MAHKLDIFKVLEALDKKDYTFYDSLSDDEKKGFTAFLTNKWMASVNGEHNLQLYYLKATNQRSNINLFSIGKHPKLQYLSLVASSPGLGKRQHNWLKNKKKETSKSKQNIKKMLAEMYPTYKVNDIEVLSTMITKREITKYLKDVGE